MQAASVAGSRAGDNCPRTIQVGGGSQYVPPPRTPVKGGFGPTLVDAVARTSSWLRIGPLIPD